MAKVKIDDLTPREAYLHGYMAALIKNHAEEFNITEEQAYEDLYRELLRQTNEKVVKK